MSTALNVSEIAELFEEEVGRLGGELCDSFSDSRRLFARAVLPFTTEVRKGDVVQGGVAVRVHGACASVRPYLLRLACVNGAIMADSGDAYEVEFSGVGAAAAEREMREAIAICASERAFLVSGELVTMSVGRRSDLALTMLALRDSFARDGLENEFADMILEFGDGSDFSTFGWMNAVTATARRVLDPEKKWRMEEIGGGVPLLQPEPTIVRSDAISLREALLRDHEALELEEALQPA